METGGEKKKIEKSSRTTSARYLRKVTGPNYDDAKSLHFQLIRKVGKKGGKFQLPGKRKERTS